MLVTDIGAEITVAKPTPEESIERQVLVEEQEININGIQYIDGKNWTVDYYRQVLNKNDQPRNLDPSLPDGEQQYYKYAKLDIKVTTPITMDAVNNISGAGVLLYIRPNIGDVFITDIEEGKKAMFVITEIAKRTYISNTVYEINYRLDTYETLDSTKFIVLERRVVKNFFYKTVDTLNEKPIITSEEQNRYIEAKNAFYYIEQDIQRNFRMEEGYIWVEKDGYTYFNFEINNLFAYISDTYIHTYRKDEKIITIFSLIESRDFNLFPLLDNVGYIRNDKFLSNPYTIRLMSVIERSPDYIIGVNGTVNTEYIVTDKYLFSTEFYSNLNVTGIERALLDYIQRKALDPTVISLLINDYYNMNDFDKYHYGVIIMVLLKEYWSNI